jgi:hypothetical protein
MEMMAGIARKVLHKVRSKGLTEANWVRHSGFFNDFPFHLNIWAEYQFISPSNEWQDRVLAMLNALGEAPSSGAGSSGWCRM